jgi:hypothetical protein
MFTGLLDIYLQGVYRPLFFLFLVVVSGFLLLLRPNLTTSANNQELQFFEDVA